MGFYYSQPEILPPLPGEKPRVMLVLLLSALAWAERRQSPLVSHWISHS